MNARLELVTNSVTFEKETTLVPPWLSRVIESVAFGMVILDNHRRVLMCNATARLSLAECGQNIALGKVVPWVTTPQGDRMQRALLQSTEGWRRMLVLTNNLDESIENPDEIKKLFVSLSPISLDDGQTGILMTTEKKAICSAQTITSFAHLFSLTVCETNVLARLARGLSPEEAAEELHISLATVRSHIKSTLQKTSSSCIRSLLVTVAKLPPMVGGVDNTEARTVNLR